MTQKSFSQVNSLTHDEFVAFLGPCFEDSDWIASETFKKIPFKSSSDLYEQLIETIRNSSLKNKLALINSYPDLVSNKILTKHSQNEHDSIGLSTLNEEKKQEFKILNDQYKSKFDIPYIACVKDMKSVEAILENFRKRLQHSTLEEEMNTALQNIYRIGWWRFQDKISSDSKL